MFSREEVRLLARCAHALMHTSEGDKDEARLFLECAAEAGDKESQLSLGLWLARMDVDGKPHTLTSHNANYKRAIYWLSRAGEQGTPAAWYAIHRIYLKAEFSQRNLAEAQRFLVKAAECGHPVAQCELGSMIWRTRKGDAARDVQAVYWLRKASAQGCMEAVPLLMKLASDAVPAQWALQAQLQLKHAACKVPPVAAARVALAARFGLSIREALLIDPIAADCGHCLVIDLRTHYPRSRRRLVLINTSEERRTLNEIAHVLAGADCRIDGAEGSYRQRLRRFRRLFHDWVEVAGRQP